ncbi:LysR family transcriptional regulator [Plastorhodobacter daqingensis]|uniref:LysR family transcriptional regulator n=1 Tax=Plastorhodobacter daqingensis TaxID=1387281 RepID=A0ABW2URT2_9RHOB
MNFQSATSGARHGSFARAGEAVGLRQSAISLQVKGFEDEFGVRLFDHSRRRRSVLTEAGRIVLVKAEEILALYDQIEPALSDEQSLAGQLKLGAIQSALKGVLPAALAVLNREHPRVRVHVASGMSQDLATKVAAGDLDAAITSEPMRPHPQDLVWTPLYEDRFWIVAPPGCERTQLRAVGFLSCTADTTDMASR